MSEHWPKELHKIGVAATEVEHIVQQLALLKQQIIDCDARRQKNVSGLAQLRRMKSSEDFSPQDLVMTCGGPFFLEMKAEAIEKFLRNEQDDITAMIESKRSKQKTLTKELMELAPDRFIDPKSLELLLK